MDKSEPEALRLARILEHGQFLTTAAGNPLANVARVLREQHARIAMLEGTVAHEPLARLWQHSETGRTRIVMVHDIFDEETTWSLVGLLYLAHVPVASDTECGNCFEGKSDLD